MKRIKKLSVMLLCCLLLSVIAMPVSASAAKLNKKSISLHVGKIYTLKASGTKGKITWTSSKKSVATVSSKGVVKAVGNGTATITVKVKDGSGKKATCKITVGTTNTPSNNTPIHTAIIGVKLNLGMINVVYGNHELHTKIDLTGDGNADQLDIQATGTGWSDNKFNGTLSISVNGKNAQKFALSSDNVCISYIALKNNIQIIRVQSGYSYSEDDFFIQYNKAVSYTHLTLPTT